MVALQRVAGTRMRLAVRSWGEASPACGPIVLLHGITGAGSDWSRVAGRLAADRVVIAYDARGHGESDWSTEEAYHADAHFADVAGLLEALRISRCILCGYSMGGGVAILAAAALGDRIAGLVVVDAYPAPEMTPGSAAIASAVADYARKQPPQMGGRPRFDPAIARRMARELEAGSARADLWPMWEAIECPVLVVRGGRSDVLPGALAAEMLARQPRAALEVIEEGGHGLPFTHPEELARAIGRFAKGKC